MRHGLMRAAVIGLTMLGWFTPQASAMLNPSQGRFMRRDSLGPRKLDLSRFAK